MQKSAPRSQVNRRTLQEDRSADAARPLEPFRVEPHDFGFDPRLELDKLNQVLDELSDLEFLQKLGK